MVKSDDITKALQKSNLNQYKERQKNKNYVNKLKGLSILSVKNESGK